MGGPFHHTPSVGKLGSPAASLEHLCSCPVCIGSRAEGVKKGSKATSQTLLPFCPQSSLAQSLSGRTASPWKCFFFSLSIWTAPHFTSRSSLEGKDLISTLLQARDRALGSPWPGWEGSTSFTVIYIKGKKRWASSVPFLFPSWGMAAPVRSYLCTFSC